MPQWWSSVKLKKFRISSVFSLRFRLRWSCWKFFSSFFFHPSHLVGLRCWNNEGLEAEIDLKKQVRRPSEKKSEVRWRYDDEDSGRKPKLVEKLDRYFPPSIRSGGYFVGEDIILFFFWIIIRHLRRCAVADSGPVSGWRKNEEKVQFFDGSTALESAHDCVWRKKNSD